MTIIHCLRGHNLSFTKFIHCYHTMCKKGVNKPKTAYVAVNIGENPIATVTVQTGANSGRTSNFWSFFRRKSTNNTKSSKETKAVQNAAVGGGGRLQKSDLKRLFSLAKPEKWKLTGAVGFLLVSSTVTMAIPFSLGRVLDIIYGGGDNIQMAQTRLNHLCGILVGVFVLGAVCNYGRIYLMSTSGYRMTQALRAKVFSAILRQEQGWFDKRSTGELVNRLSADTQIVGQALSANISDGLRSTVMVCAGTGMMFYMSPQLALVGMAVVPPVAIVAVIYGRFVRGITRKVQDSLAEATKVADERISNMRTVKSFSKEPTEIRTYINSLDEVLKMSYTEAKYRGIFYGFAGFSGNVIIISVLYYGGVMVTSQTLTIGHLSSFLLYAAYIGISVGGLSSFYSELNKSVGAASRIWEIIDRQPEVPMTGGVTPISPPEGRIVFKNVKFAYPARPTAHIFTNLNLEIRPGRTVAVVGASGSGKSTLGALLLRLYDPEEGAITLDGYDVKQLDPSWVRRYIGSVSQEPILFSCSIRENILYGALDGQKTVSDDELIRVAREANVLEFVQQLPHGFDTLVGERGVMLSGGQKQRVAIARALIRNPKILILDEATSALDAQSEHWVQEALDRIMEGRTVLTIAHRLSTIQRADAIAVLQDGQIVEEGNYKDLINRRSGAFSDLMKHQTFQGPMEQAN